MIYSKFIFFNLFLFYIYIQVLEKKIKIRTLVRYFCQYGTTPECEKDNKTECKKVQFNPIIKPHTEVSLGACYIIVVDHFNQ